MLTKSQLAFRLLEIEALAMSLKARALLDKEIHVSEFIRLRTLSNNLISDTCNLKETEYFLAK